MYINTYKIGDYVWFKPNKSLEEPIKLKIVKFNDPGIIELEEGEVLYVLTNEDKSIWIDDATYLDIRTVKETK